jgi:hypothetical protein
LEKRRQSLFAEYLTFPEAFILDNETFLRFMTQDIVAVGKDIISAIATGQYLNTSVFRCESGTSYPILFESLLKQIFTKKGYLRDEFDLSRLTHIRTIFMMYYKFEVPFTATQQDEAFSKFIDLDFSVKEDLWPSDISHVRKRFLSYLPDNPWDIRPHHGSGATNTPGVSNLEKVMIHRDFMFDGTPYQHLVRPSLYKVSTLTSDDSYKKARITVVPKDSRGPRIISMEPHERMRMELGTMDKIVYFQENLCEGTKGYVNYTDQSINQRAAYESSISGSRATLDLKDASDLVSNSLIVKLTQGTEWEHVFSLLRSTNVYVGSRDITLKKFACMGNALCFPIMATLIRAILYELDPHTLVYGDDIIIDSAVSARAIELLHSYGLRVNEDKSFSKGPFRESCGGDFITGVNVNYVKVKSFSPVKFIAFANNVSEMISQKHGELILKNYENIVNIQVFRAPKLLNYKGESVTTPNVFNTSYYSSNDVFFKKRYDKDIQQHMYMIHAPGTVDLQRQRKKQPYGEDILREFLCNAMQYISPLEDIRFQKACSIFLYPRPVSFPEEKGEVTFRSVAKRQELKWLVAETLGL